MRVLLLLSPHENAIFRHGGFMLPPLSLGVIAALLKSKGHEVQLVDLNAIVRKRPSAETKEELKFLYSKESYLRVLQADGTSPEIRAAEELLSDIDVRSFDLIGISLGSDFSFLQIHLGFLIGAILKQRFRKQVVFGGNNVTFLYLFKEFFRDLWRVVLPMFPLIIKGPGEMPLLSLLAGSKDSPGPGCVYMARDEIRCQTESTPLITRPDFETLDMTLYESCLEAGTDQQTIERNLSLLYRWPGHLTRLVNSVRLRLNDARYERKTVIPYIFNYGCPFRCTFCTQSGDAEKRVIVGDVDLVVDDLEDLTNRWGSEYFYFLNNAFNNSTAFADRFCEKVLQKGMNLYWSDCGRFNNMTEDRIVAMAKAGCKKITFGFETASPWILRYIDKRIELDQAEKVLGWCKKHGIWVDLEVIVGLPYETDERFQETVDFVERNASRINGLALNQYFVVPNSLIGLYPERYRVELIKNYMTYEELLAKNYEALLGEHNMTAENFRLYRYNESGPYREHRDIVEHTRRHLETLINFKSDEFKDVERNFHAIDRLLDASGVSL